ncbi:MAG: hypothetical protein ISS70_02985 [Phycisphaerae bacterium]|nr:hypothetical protein [Phycisphaerae bacterium]
MCLLAQRHFNIPWDQLGSLPGRGKRFDYRGTDGILECIFESKGTSHVGYQSKQIGGGIDKKNAHHARGEQFDLELIVSTFIGHGEGPPRIVLSDPDKNSFRRLYERGDIKYHRLKHYCRVLQFIGLPRSAYALNLYAYQYLARKHLIPRTIIDEQRDRNLLETITIDGDEFIGRWFDSWLPKESIRYKRLYGKEKKLGVPLFSGRRFVFQGLRRDIYDSGMTSEPFSQPLLTKPEIEKYQHFDQSVVSVFSDGTVMVFRQI